MSVSVVSGEVCVVTPPHTFMLAPARQLANRWLSASNLHCRDLELVLTELLANAIDSSDQTDSSVRVRVWLADERVQCVVANSGVWTEAVKWGSPQGHHSPRDHRTTVCDLETLAERVAERDQPSPHGRRGRGLRLVVATTDRATVMVRANSTEVHAELPLLQ